MRAIVWQITYKCNNRCPYCTIYSKYDGEGFIQGSRWVDAFNKLRPEVIDITGGEPFLHPDLINIINGFDPAIKIGLTTNLTQDLTQFVQKVSPQRLISMTLSFHPSMTMSKDMFIGRAMLLAARGFNVNVNFVAYPEQMYLIPLLAPMFRDFGIRFHIDPYAQHEGKQYEFSEFEKNYLRQLLGQDRSFRLDTDRPVVKCSGGKDYIMVLPDGTAHRCMHFNLTGRKPVGSIFDKDFRINDSWDICDQFNECGGCDRDKIEYEVVDEKTAVDV